MIKCTRVIKTSRLHFGLRLLCANVNAKTIAVTATYWTGGLTALTIVEHPSYFVLYQKLN